MKKNKLTAIVSMLLAFLILTSLAGCKKENQNASKEPQGTNAEVLGYPITTEPLTLKYWLPIAAPATTYIKSYAENEVYQEMEKITGVKVEYIHPAVGQENEQFNLMIASGDLPDMIQGAARYKGGVDKGVDDGVFLDLNQYVQKYAPDYYKLINSKPEVKRQNTYGEGKIYSFNKIKPEEDVPFRRASTRTDWLAEAGKKEPKTIAEWESYLKFIKDNKSGVAPYILAQNGMEPTFMGAYNVVTDFYLKDGKKVDFGQIQPEFKEYLTLMNKWYSSGYISKDFPSFTEAKALTEYGAGKTAVIIRDTGNPYVTAQANKFSSAPLPFPRVKLGDKLHWYVTEWTNTGSETVVSSKTKYKTEAIRWLNYGYTTDGAMLFNYGVKDRTYVMENGKPKFTDYAFNNPKYPISVVGHILRLHFAAKLTYRDVDCLPTLQVDKAAMENRLMWSDDKDVDNAYVLPPVKLTLDEISKRTPIMTEVNTYISEMILKFIIGTEPLSRFDEYVSHVRKLGIDQAIQVTQQAYDRYMK